MSALLDQSMDWWLRLRHGGQLLNSVHLDDRREIGRLTRLPTPAPLPWNLPDRLRAAVTSLPHGEAASGEPLTILLDLMLEEVAGLKVGWLKGSKLGTDHGETLLDGTRIKPRRVWEGMQGETLHIFTTKVPRVGLHRGRRPVAQVIEYLRRKRTPLGLVTNGRQWRLIYADADTQAWVEWDTDEFFGGGQLSDSVPGFARLLSRRALERGEVAERSPLLAAIAETRSGQAKLSSELGERVRSAVEALLVSRRPVLEPAWDDLEPQAVYGAACHFVMRIVVTLFAEARGLLPLDNPVYHHGYGVTGLFESLDKVSDLRLRGRHSAWSRLLALFTLLHEGSPHPALNLPAYGGELFRPGQPKGDAVQRSLHLLEATASPPDDKVIHDLLRNLTRTTVRIRDGRAWRRVDEAVNFADLSSEYIGILYEGLLDYELHKAGDDAVLFLNLGDQPALPIARLEAMDDKAIKALVEKIKGSDGLVVAAEDEAPEEPFENEVQTTDEQSEPEADDLREAALQRAMTWASRAVKIGKLVKKAKGKDLATQQQRAADALIADLKLPGELYLVRWGGTRKGAGTFYTRPQLTMPTVRRTLEPLTHLGGKAKAPEDILKLKVVDPAMGSGSFLVATLRVLTRAIIDGAYDHDRVQSAGNRTRVEITTFADADRNFDFASDDPRFAAALTARVKRYVVEHCLYGVDIDRLAVELARVALWVETLDQRLPFTFLDHKLKAGNSLVGCWLDRFRDYPALAWVRESPDKTHKGVHHPKNTWHKALGAKKKDVKGELPRVILGQQAMGFAGGDDAQVRQDVKRIRSLFGRLRRIPAGQPAKRATIYRKQIEPDPALARLKQAFNTWCALWFWPLDDLDTAPMPRDFLAPSETTQARVKRLAREHRFFHWELEFPDVFHSQGSGFDAVVGNPPWEIQKPNSKEFFSNIDPLYRGYGKQEALDVQQELFAGHSHIEYDWLAYQADFKARGNFVRNAGNPYCGGTHVDGKWKGTFLGASKKGLEMRGKWARQRRKHKGFSDPEHPFMHQGSADLNTYKMFVEVGHALLAANGELGLIVPSGIYTDKGTGDLRRLLLERCRWRWLFGFENRRKVFDIDGRFKFCVLIAQKGGRTDSFRAAFMRHDLADWGEAAEAGFVLDYPAERVRAFSPKSLSVLEIRTEQDLEVLTKIYANSVLLGDDSPEGWGITYATEFHMTNDSKLFPPRGKWEKKGYRPDEYGRWVGPDGDVALPLYEGRMIGQFDFSEKGWVSGKGRSAVWRDIPWDAKVVAPQYLMAKSVFNEHIAPRPWKLLMMNIGSATNQRTMIASLGPEWPANHSLAVLSGAEPDNDLLLAAIVNSLVYDWALRLRVGGLNLSWFILEETPLPRVLDSGRGLVASLVHGEHPALARLAAKHALPRRAAITQAERLRIRAALDAIVAGALGLERASFRWLLRDCDHATYRLSTNDFTRTLDPKGFWRVDKGKPPELRHTVLSLVAFDDLQALIEAHAGDRDAGIKAFCDQNDGEGWMLPKTLRLADYGLGHDERAQEHQPVASALGPRFLDWQYAQTPDESWAECEQHARALTQGQPSYPTVATASPRVAKAPKPPTKQVTLGFDED